MPSDRRIRVMLSSRCTDPIHLEGRSADFTALRRSIKSQLKAVSSFGGPLFECWINEDSPPTEGSTNSWDACLKQVRAADIVLVLYNGNPGWSIESDGVGICHAELQMALISGAAKVFAIELPSVPLPPNGSDSKRFKRFREYFAAQNLFVTKARDGDEALSAVPGAMHEALVELVNLGGRETRKGRYDTGEALDWSRSSFPDRKARMEAVVAEAVVGRAEGKEQSGHLYTRIGGTDVLVRIHAIPGAFSNAVAREMVGRPFHYDHEVGTALGSRKGGPVHLIACHRGVTERQAAELLGQPDAATVDTKFGVLAFDRVSGIQCLFLRNCRDDTSARIAVQTAFEWLRRSGEDRLVAQRAISRARIVKAIAAENVS